MADKETFYRNILVNDDRDEVAVRAIDGYGPLIEIIIDGDIADIVVRISEPRGAIELGNALIQAAQSLIRSQSVPRTMMSRKSDYIKQAAEAHTNLNVFASVVSLLEGGHLYGATSDRTAQRIIEICKAEQDRCLARYDSAVAAATNGERA